MIEGMEMNNIWATLGLIEPILWFALGITAWQAGKRTSAILVVVSLALSQMWPALLYEDSWLSPLLLTANIETGPQALFSNLVWNAKALALLAAYHFAVAEPKRTT